MTKRQGTGNTAERRDIPTVVGDVLILETERSFDTYAVGRIHFGSGVTPTYVTDHSAAVNLARSLATSGRRIFFMNIATGDWHEISE
jgi:hypothetical protein